MTPKNSISKPNKIEKHIYSKTIPRRVAVYFVAGASARGGKIRDAVVDDNGGSNGIGLIVQRKPANPNSLKPT